MLKRVFKLAFNTMLFCSASSFAAGHTPGSSEYYQFSNDPGGFDAVDFAINVIKDPGSTANIFWSNQFGFKDSNQYGYTGMQSNEGNLNSRTFLFSVWNATEAKVGSSGSYCLKFTEGQSGYSCRMQHIWREGDNYQFQLSHTGGGWFTVSVTATEPDGTTKAFVLGSIKTDATKISSSGMSGWTEYFEWNNDRSTCTGQPYSSAFLPFPTGTLSGNAYPAHISDTSISQDCKDFSKVTVQSSGSVQENGTGNSLRSQLGSAAENGCMVASGFNDGASLTLKECLNQPEGGWVYAKGGSIETRNNYCMASAEPDLGEIKLQTCDHTSPNFQWDISKSGQIKKYKTDMCLTDVGANQNVILRQCDGSPRQNWSVNLLGLNNSGCILDIDSGGKFCLSAGQKSLILPDWIKGHNVYVQADPGTSVTLSDWSNLSYSRTATFVGTVVNEKLKHVKADNGEYLDFSQPFSMRVDSSQKPLGCIINTMRAEQFCLPAGEKVDYALPAWIKGQDVYVQATPGTSVTLSDWDNLSYNRTATFTGFVKNADLKNVKADNGEYLNFSKPFSMRVNEG